MRPRKKNFKKPEYQNETPSSLKYFKKEIVTQTKQQFPDASEEDVIEMILNSLKPLYEVYSYTMSVTDEFVSEDPLSVSFMFQHLVTECKGCRSDFCLDQHPGQNLRRKPERLFNGIWNYLPFICKVSSCASDCEFSHNTEEMVYHPILYKTKICSYATVNGVCKEKGKFCPNAHGDLRQPSSSQYELKSPPKPEEQKLTETVFVLDTFKTKPCKLTGYHDKERCLFFHDNKDHRRDPVKYKYSSTPCPVGFNKDFKCRYKENCKYSHNTIEELYHTEVYQTKPCIKNPCKMDDKCPYSHQSNAIPKENIQSKIKNYVDANKMLREELEDIQAQLQEFSIFICHFCNTEVSESILTCGHLTCSKCLHGDSCDLCFFPIYPIIEIKLI
jgi:hypothetical protein